MDVVSQQAHQLLLESAQINAADIDIIFRQCLPAGVDFADIFFQKEVNEAWSLEDGIVKTGTYNDSTGLGARVIVGEEIGFAYADYVTLQTLKKAVNTASSAVRSGGGSVAISPFGTSRVKRLYQTDDPLESMASQAKVAWLKEVDQYCRKQDSRISKVNISLFASQEIVFVVATDGTFIGDIRPMVRMNISVIADNGEVREQGYSGFGGRYDYEQLYKQDWREHADQAIRTALLNLDAKPAPAGDYPIVLGSGWPGILLHEAIGHGLEGDFNRKGSSSFHQLIGEMVASSQCTIVDDGTLSQRRGSLSIDDEGTPTQCTTLIEAGRLQQFMFDKHNARLMGVCSTGNGRRESYASLPLPRMTNTYMLPGQYAREELVANVDKGIYAVNFSGGQVDITSGKFVFVVNEAYLIEQGKITTPLKGATLIGDGLSALKQISMVADDMQLDDGVGTCGKEGQSVPVGVGQPSVLLNRITVGGTAIN